MTRKALAIVVLGTAACAAGPTEAPLQVGTGVALSVSADQRWLAWVDPVLSESWPPRGTLWVRELPSGEALRLTDRCTSATFSRAQDVLLVRTHEEPWPDLEVLHVWRPGMHGLHRLTDGALGVTRWGRIILGASRDHSYVVYADWPGESGTGALKVLRSADCSAQQCEALLGAPGIDVVQLDVPPTGRFARIEARLRSGSLETLRRAILVMDLDRATWREVFALPDGPTMDDSILVGTISPDGTRVAIPGPRVLATDSGADQGFALPSSRRPFYAPTLSDASTLFVVNGVPDVPEWNDTQLDRLTPTTSETVTAANWARAYTDPPGAERFVLYTTTPWQPAAMSQQTDFYILDARRRGSAPLKVAGAAWYWPIISDDLSLAAVLNDHDGESGKGVLRLVRLDGTSDPIDLLPSGGGAFLFAGRHVLVYYAAFGTSIHARFDDGGPSITVADNTRSFLAASSPARLYISYEDGRIVRMPLAE